MPPENSDAYYIYYVTNSETVTVSRFETTKKTLTLTEEALPTLTDDSGKGFVGWYTTSTFADGTKLTVGQTYTFTDSTIFLFAKWEEGIQFQISRIQNNVTASLAAVAAKGVTVASDSTSDDLPSLISSISAQSSGTTVSTSTPRNLLDNSNFANPVNQRGQTTYTGSDDYTFTIDRWIVSGGDTVAIAAKDSPETYSDAALYIDVGNAIYQFFEADLSEIGNGIFTFAACDTDGNVYCVTTAGEMTGEVLIDESSHLATMDGFAPMGNGRAIGLVGINKGSWRWAAVYAGEYTVDTLPEYVPKGYTAELLECQRYYYRVPSTSAMGYPGYASSTTQARITVQTPVPMRTTPTVTMEAISQARIFDSAGAKTPTAVSVQETDGNGVALAFTTSYLTAWTTCSARFNATVELDAEIYDM